MIGAKNNKRFSLDRYQRPVHSDPLFWTTSLVVGPWGILASYTCVRAILPQCSNLSHTCVVREARPMLNFLNQCYSFTGNYRSFRIHAELLKCKKRIYVLSLFKCFIFFLRKKLIRLGIIYLETYLSCIGFLTYLVLASINALLDQWLRANGHSVKLQKGNSFLPFYSSPRFVKFLNFVMTRLCFEQYFWWTKQSVVVALRLEKVSVR